MTLTITSIKRQRREPTLDNDALICVAILGVMFAGGDWLSGFRETPGTILGTAAGIIALSFLERWIIRWRANR